MAFVFKLARYFNCNFLLSSLVREDIFSVRVSSEWGGGLGTGLGFKYKPFARERGKEQVVWTGPVITLILLCVGYLTPKEV